MPKARGIRRSCQKELYRTAKRLDVWISPDKMAAAEKLYFRKVVENLLWIVENGSKRKILADWFEKEVAQDIAEIWEVPTEVLARAFRNAFGG